MPQGRRSDTEFPLTNAYPDKESARIPLGGNHLHATHPIGVTEKRTRKAVVACHGRSILVLDRSGLPVA